MIHNEPAKYKEKVLTKNINFKFENAEKINKTISSFNSENQFLKINNDILLNMIVENFFSQADNNNVNVNEYIKNKLINEVKK